MYDLEWAERVFDKFYCEHAIACHEINRLYRISSDACVRSLANGSPRWRGYKSLVAHAEKAMASYWRHWHSDERVREKYYTFDKYLRKQFSRRQFPAPLDLVDTMLEQDLPF